MNYQHVLLLGAGTIGKGLLKIGKRQLSSFETISVLDLEPMPESCHNGYKNIDVHVGDAEDLDLLTYLLKPASKRAVVINLCSGVDAVRIRSHLGMLGNAAYLDTSAGLLPDRSQDPFDSLMNYNHTYIDSTYPQWICWGMNPGLVEIVARRLMLEGNTNSDREHCVTIYEHDSLDTATKSGKLGVGWSPRELIEEFMITSNIEIKNGEFVQDERRGSQPIEVCWGDEIINSRMVAHEDIWNLGLLPEVRSARFTYALSPGVMEVLSGPVAVARERLEVPEEDVPLIGKDRIAVQVLNGSEEEKCLIWETDHAAVWTQHGVNAVQYQVCKGIQAALELLQYSELGLLGGTYCASTLPLNQGDWQMMEKVFSLNGIDWRYRDAPSLETPC